MVSTIIILGLFTIFESSNCIESEGVVVARKSLSDEIIEEPLSRIHSDPGGRSRRLLVNDEECTLFEMAIETNDSIYDDNTEQPQILRDENEWLCQFDVEYSREVLGLDDPLVRLSGWTPDSNSGPVAQAKLDGDDFDVGEIVESGRTTIKIREGIIDREEQAMYMESELVQVTRNEDHIRKLQDDDIRPISGVRKVLVVRISTNDFSYKPEVTSQQLRASLFGNRKGQVSLKRKYLECSYRKLKIRPFVGTTSTGVEIPKGVVNVKLSGDQSKEVIDLIRNGGKDPLENKRNRDRVLSFCRLSAEKRLGNLESQFDHVLFVLPRSLDGVLAIAIIGRWDSYYGGSWVTRPSMPLHEIGHNLGLDHAGELSVYDDKVGYMGFSYDEKNGPNMCFNPANNYFLGWYKPQTASFDAETSGTGRFFVINGIADYKPKKANIGNTKRLVVLRLTQSNRAWDFYIGYNRVKGINSGTEESGNSILILRKYGPASSTSVTRKIGTLFERGQYFEIADYNGAIPVFITYEDKINGGRDVIIRVSTTRPTPSPSLSPTPSPTRTPTATPTPQPTTATPTSTPTATPTATPTSRPTPRPTFVGEITDRDDFKYNDRDDRDCNWVAENDIRCLLKWQRKNVKTYWCKKTCESVNYCLENLSFAYGDDSNKNCDWVAEDLDRRCEFTWRNKKVKDHWCPTTCDTECDPPPSTTTMRRRQDTQAARRKEI